MPIRPTSPQRPWIKKVNYNIPGQGRKIVNKFYQSKAWRRFTREHRIIEPLCRECKKDGIITPAYCTDHIKPINPLDSYDTMNGRYGEPLDHDNAQSLCESCHAKKSAKEK